MDFPQITREEIRKKGFPEPITLSEEVMDSLSWKQGQILSTLAFTAEKEQRLINEINALAPTPSGVLIVGGALTLCEDDDDWKVITMNQRIELKRVRDEMNAALSEALDCGLGCLGLIQRQCPNYGVTP